MSSELTIIIKDDEKTLRTKTLIYDEYAVSENDPLISKLVETAKRNFDGTPTDIIVRIQLTIQ
jgi:hypothetical protein